MFHFETVTTEGLPTRKKVQFWNDVTSETLTEQCAEPLDPLTFSGRVRRVNLGVIRLAEISASASTVTRNRVHIAHTAEAPYVLRLLLSGELVSILEGIEIKQRPGDFALYDTSRPYRMILRDKTTLLSIRIPKEQLLQHIPSPEAVTSLVVSGMSAAGSLTSRFLKEFWSGSENVILCDAAPRIANIALQLIASSYAMLPQPHSDRSCLVTRHRLQIVMYIEEHLRDPDLTPTSIAAALRVSPGYAHRIFSDESESIARFVLRRRLERCREALVDPLQAGRSITAIAFGFGFNSIAHFSRVFREHYGVTPREFRHDCRPDPKARRVDSALR
jgi:AraC family transcriptional activator of tynA and feaB